MNNLQIAIAGLGTVGKGTYQLLMSNKETINRRSGTALNINKVASRRRKQDCDLGATAFQTDILALATDPNVDIVVELLGGTDLALELVRSAIANGKHVVTANKALIATHGNELIAAAQQQGVVLAYEAAVAGGIPIINGLHNGLSANNIKMIAGIINGTSNYILTQMSQNGLSFADALAGAQQLGYAEADPSFDIEGVDAAHKLAILASIAFDIPMVFDEIYIEGITDIEGQDVLYASELGFALKHLGIARQSQLTNENIELRVHPTMIPKDQLLAAVNNAMNAVMVEGDSVGPTLFYGAGAGAMPTASAVVADIIEIARKSEAVHHGTNMEPSARLAPTIIPMANVESEYYLRIQALDEPGVLSLISNQLSEHHINVESLLQKNQSSGETSVPVILVTGKTAESNIDQLIKVLEARDEVIGSITRYRIENL